jgi:hypothetical protein
MSEFSAHNAHDRRPIGRTSVSCDQDFSANCLVRAPFKRWACSQVAIRMAVVRGQERHPNGRLAPIGGRLTPRRDGTASRTVRESVESLSWRAPDDGEL